MDLGSPPGVRADFCRLIVLTRWGSRQADQPGLLRSLGPEFPALPSIGGGTSGRHPGRAGGDLCDTLDLALEPLPST